MGLLGGLLLFAGLGGLLTGAFGIVIGMITGDLHGMGVGVLIVIAGMFSGAIATSILE